MRAEILAIGDEITSGQLLDTNSQWLSQRLESLGIRTAYHSTVGDELDPCVAAFRQAADRAEIVIATGGLGPTADDLTREAIAKAAERPLVLDAGALEHVRGLFARRNRPMPPQNELQAMFPEGSRVIPNPHGTAPGIDIDIPRPGRSPSRIFALPGVPAEMREMWDGYLLPALEPLGHGRVVLRRNIRCFGAGESQVESMLPDLIRRGRSPTVGINASGATIILRIAAEGGNLEECQRLIEPTAAIIRQSLGNLVFGEGTDELQDAVIRLLRDQHKTLATVEVATQGLVTDWLASAANAAEAFRGGLVLHDWIAARRLLGEVLEGVQTERGGVDPENGTSGSSECKLPDPTSSIASAETLAAACRQRFATDFALVIGGSPITGTAQGAGQAAVPIAVATQAGVQSRLVPLGLHPALVRTYAAKSAINFLRLALMETSAAESA